MINLSELAIIALTSALGHLALWMYLLLKKGYAKPSPVLLSAYLLLASVWNLIILLQEVAIIPRLTGYSWPSAYLYPLIPMATLLWPFTYAFLQLPKPKLWRLMPGGAILLIMGLLDANIIPLPLIYIPFTYLILDKFTINFWLTVVTVAGYLIYTASLILRTRKRIESPRHQNRIQFLFLSLIGLSIGGGLFLSRLPLPQTIGLLIHWLGALLLTYLSVNQYLPDIRSSFKEFIRILVVGLFSVAIYTLTIYAALLLWPGSSKLNIAVVGAVALTLFFLPLQRLVHNLANRVLYRDQYNEKQIINAYINTISNILLLEDLVSASLLFIKNNLNIKRGSYFLLSNHDDIQYNFRVLPSSTFTPDETPPTLSIKKNTPLTQRLLIEGKSISQYSLDLIPEFSQADPEGINALKQMGLEQYVPVKRNEELIAILALGPFASGASYRIKDIDLLSTMATQTAIALENSRLFENVSNSLEEITRIKKLTDNVFASIESGVITVDTENKIVMLNPAMQRILNLPPDTYAGSNIGDVLRPLENTPLSALLRDVKSTHRSYQAYEITPDIPGRGVLNLSVDLSPIRDARKQLKGVALVINDYTENRRLQVVQNLFKKYLSPAVVDRLPDDPTELKLGGHRQSVTILFADIRGFSTFSEHQEPEDLINVLNKYLSMAAESILAYEGTLDKFMGDAVMAIFNAPLPQADHTFRAVKAAAAMQQAINEFHVMMGEYRPHLSFGVGIHVGEAVVGNVGTQARMDYTAVGDAVNLAKRIQENAPGGSILLSQNAYEAVKDKIRAVPHKELTVKGRETPEQTYELLNIN